MELALVLNASARLVNADTSVDGTPMSIQFASQGLMFMALLRASGPGPCRAVGHSLFICRGFGFWALWSHSTRNGGALM